MYQKIVIAGHVGRDPEVRTIPNGIKVANFSVATSESYRDKSGKVQTKTEWHKVNAWAGLAEIAEKYITKGSLVLVEGTITTRSWDDQNGQKRYSTEIKALAFKLLGGRRSENQDTDSNFSSSNSEGDSNFSAEPPVPPQAPEDDLPF